MYLIVALLRIGRFKRFLPHWMSSFLGSTSILFLINYKLLDRTHDIVPSIGNMLFATSTDILWFNLLAIPIFLFLDRRIAHVLAFLLINVFIIGVLFQTKVGQPFTFSVFSQVGGIFEMQTSLYAETAGRTLYFFLVLNAVYMVLTTAVYYFLKYLDLYRHPWFLGKALLNFLLLFVFIAIHFYDVSYISDFRINLLNSKFRETDLHSEMLSNKIFAEFSEASSPLEPFARVEVKADESIERKNIVVLFLESFNWEFVEDEERFARVMPFLHSWQKDLVRFDRHYTVWPYSSKSLYTAICNRFPHLHHSIEMRVKPKEDCRGWTSAFAKAGYKLFTGYSGDWAYDNMGPFLRAQGFTTLIDRTLLKQKYPSIKENSWGMDDRAIFESAQRWISEQKVNNFVVFLIPINTHHPGWIPSNDFKKFDIAHEDAFYYQDHLIQNLVNHLRKQNLLEKTIVLITGDHGRRFVEQKLSPGVLPEIDFRVPLFIYDANSSQAGTSVQKPSTHMEIGGFLLNRLGVPGSYLTGHRLRGERPAYLFFTIPSYRFKLITEERALLFSLDEEKIFQGVRWVSDQSEECLLSDCREQREELLRIIHQSLRMHPKLSAN